ncbi:MAG: cell wall-active antibiotics response protein [Chitinophagaceae bacterium]|nr:cell wall-active antibiotics response protein [Chitinophagaceae bacterium]
MSTNQFPNKPSGRGNTIAGLILVGVGVTLVLRNMNFPFPDWIFTWPMILILIGIYTGVKHNFRNSAWFILIFIGCFFLFDKLIPGISLEPYFWPILIIGVGILFILRPGRSYRAEQFKYKDWGTSESFQGFASTTGVDNNDYLNISSVFSGIQRSVLSKNFHGGRISCVFGGAEIDLTQADITGIVTLRMEAVFGGVKLIVPPHWQVINEIDGVFHGVDDKRKSPTGAYAEINKTLILKGSVVFGGIEIRSY